MGYLYTQNNPRTDWCFRLKPEPGLHNRQLAYPRGRVMGGCSSINGMIYMRGQAEDYDGWASATRDPSWSWEKVLPYFIKSEDHSRGADSMHGAGGEWRVEDPRIRWELLDVFRKATTEVGIPESDDFNRGSNEGCGYFQVNQRDGWRVNAAKAFLGPKIRGRPNLTIATNVQASRIVFGAGNRAAGLEVEVEGSQKVIPIAERGGEVILTAGSIGSPQLLQLSGVGPEALLKKHGIPVVHRLEGVGKNLMDHLQLRLVFKVSNILTMNEIVQSPIGKLKMGLEYALWRTGPLSMAPSQMGCFTRSSSAHARPNLQYHIQPLSLDRFGEPLHEFPAFTASVCNLRPESRGSVEIVSKSHKDAPSIQANYLLADADKRVAVEAIQLTRHIVLGTEAFKPLSPEEIRPGSKLTEFAELVDAAGMIGTTIFHPAGTCKMGVPEDKSAVVDSKLRVLGVEGVRVVDASVMPTITSGNTSSPVVMIGERAADLILNQ